MERFWWRLLVSLYLLFAAWISVGPVIETARWLGFGAIDWVFGVLVFFALLALAQRIPYFDRT